jgi:CRISPR-associated protein Cas1
MLRKTIEIATPGTRLSVAHRQLMIQRPDTKAATVPIEDIGVLVIDDRRASHTQAVFVELIEAGATVVVCGDRHLPTGMMLPLDAHHVLTERHRAQVEASEPARKQIWRALVAAKLAQQGSALDSFGHTPNGLAEMARRVRSGDPDNLEAQGAQRYWPMLFGKEFRRDRGAEGVNALGFRASTSARPAQRCSRCSTRRLSSAAARRLFFWRSRPAPPRSPGL